MSEEVGCVPGRWRRSDALAWRCLEGVRVGGGGILIINRQRPGYLFGEPFIYVEVGLGDQGGFLNERSAAFFRKVIDHSDSHRSFEPAGGSISQPSPYTFTGPPHQHTPFVAKVQGSPSHPAWAFQGATHSSENRNFSRGERC